MPSHLKMGKKYFKQRVRRSIVNIVSPIDESIITFSRQSSSMRMCATCSEKVAERAHLKRTLKRKTGNYTTTTLIKRKLHQVHGPVVFAVEQDDGLYITDELPSPAPCLDPEQWSQARSMMPMGLVQVGNRIQTDVEGVMYGGQMARDMSALSSAYELEVRALGVLSNFKFENLAEGAGCAQPSAISQPPCKFNDATEEGNMPCGTNQLAPYDYGSHALAAKTTDFDLQDSCPSSSQSEIVCGNCGDYFRWPRMVYEEFEELETYQNECHYGWPSETEPHNVTDRIALMRKLKRQAKVRGMRKRNIKQKKCGAKLGKKRAVNKKVSKGKKESVGKKKAKPINYIYWTLPDGELIALNPDGFMGKKKAQRHKPAANAQLYSYAKRGKKVLKRNAGAMRKVKLPVAKCRKAIKKPVKKCRKANKPPMKKCRKAIKVPVKKCRKTIKVPVRKCRKAKKILVSKCRKAIKKRVNKPQKARGSSTCQDAACASVQPDDNAQGKRKTEVHEYSELNASGVRNKFVHNEIYTQYLGTWELQYEKTLTFELNPQKQHNARLDLAQATLGSLRRDCNIEFKRVLTGKLLKADDEPAGAAAAEPYKGLFKFESIVTTTPVSDSKDCFINRESTLEVTNSDHAKDNDNLPCLVQKTIWPVRKYSSLGAPAQKPSAVTTPSEFSGMKPYELIASTLGEDKLKELQQSIAKAETGMPKSAGQKRNKRGQNTRALLRCKSTASGGKRKCKPVAKKLMKKKPRRMQLDEELSAIFPATETILPALLAEVTPSTIFSACDMILPPLSAEETPSALLSASDMILTPLLAEETPSTLLSASETMLTPLLEKEKSSLPLSATATMLPPLSAGETPTALLSASETMLTPLSAGETSSTPLSASEINLPALLAEEKSSLPLSATETMLPPLQAEETPSTLLSTSAMTLPALLGKEKLPSPSHVEEVLESNTDVNADVQQLQESGCVENSSESLQADVDMTATVDAPSSEYDALRPDESVVCCEEIEQNECEELQQYEYNSLADNSDNSCEEEPMDLQEEEDISLEQAVGQFKQKQQIISDNVVGPTEPAGECSAEIRPTALKLTPNTLISLRPHFKAQLQKLLGENGKGAKKELEYQKAAAQSCKELVKPKCLKVALKNNHKAPYDSDVCKKTTSSKNVNLPQCCLPKLSYTPSVIIKDCDDLSSSSEEEEFPPSSCAAKRSYKAPLVSKARGERKKAPKSTLRRKKQTKGDAHQRKRVPAKALKQQMNAKFDKMALKCALEELQDIQNKHPKIKSIFESAKAQKKCAQKQPKSIKKNKSHKALCKTKVRKTASKMRKGQPKRTKHHYLYKFAPRKPRLKQPIRYKFAPMPPIDDTTRFRFAPKPLLQVRYKFAPKTRPKRKNVCKKVCKTKQRRPKAAKNKVIYKDACKGRNPCKFKCNKLKFKQYNEVVRFCSSKCNGIILKASMNDVQCPKKLKLAKNCNCASPEELNESKKLAEMEAKQLKAPANEQTAGIEPAS